MEMEFDFILRIFVAALLGGAIGLEREYRAKEAGSGSAGFCSVYDCICLWFRGCRYAPWPSS